MICANIRGWERSQSCATVAAKWEMWTLAFRRLKRFDEAEASEIASTPFLEQMFPSQNNVFEVQRLCWSFPDPRLVVYNWLSGWGETNFLLIIHPDNHTQWTQLLSTLFATLKPWSAYFACTTDGGQWVERARGLASAWLPATLAGIAFVTHSGTKMSFNLGSKQLCCLWVEGKGNSESHFD